MEFLTIFGIVVAKNRAFENKIIFLQHISISVGWDSSLGFLLAAPMKLMFCGWTKVGKILKHF